jgi:hypothetical protein
MGCMDKLNGYLCLFSYCFFMYWRRMKMLHKEILRQRQGKLRVEVNKEHIQRIKEKINKIV